MITRTLVLGALLVCASIGCVSPPITVDPCNGCPGGKVCDEDEGECRDVCNYSYDCEYCNDCQEGMCKAMTTCPPDACAACTVGQVCLAEKCYQGCAPGSTTCAAGYECLEAPEGVGYCSLIPTLRTEGGRFISTGGVSDSASFRVQGGITGWAGESAGQDIKIQAASP